MAPMNTASLIASVLAVLLVCGHLFASRRDRRAHDELMARMTSRVNDLAASATSTVGLSKRVDRAESTLEELARSLAALDEASKAAITAVSTTRPPGAEALERGGPTPRVGTEPPAVDSAEEAEFADLFERLLGHDMDLHGSPEDIERFWQLARTTGVVDAQLKRLAAQVEGNPRDVGLRMALARAYVAKLFTVPGGPEQGLWGERAEAQWQTVLELEPEHWEAQFTLANNWGYYPDFMGKTADAIAGLEHARQIQQGLAPDPRHVQTYLSLARLYQRKGDEERVRSILEAGLSFFPGDEQLLAVLAELDQ